MTEIVRYVNAFLKKANRADIDSVLSKIVLSDRQEKIFELVCIKRHDICFVADTLGYCPMVINIDLRNIKTKIYEALNEDEEIPF